MGPALVQRVFQAGQMGSVSLAIPRRWFGLVSLRVNRALQDMADFTTSIVREQAEGHKALLELESEFNAKPQTAVLSIQGSQIRALARFARIFEIYPYPVVINAAVLKLADWFRTSNNIVKIYVYKVFKEASDLHLAKVFNVEEAVRRILLVLNSNDPVARSIALRVLGCMSMIVAEKLEVHHGILLRLELATDRIEVEAAIWAGDQICARSARFPAVIFSKIITKLQHPDTSFDIKLRLVKMFRHMHTDLAMARQAKLTCLELLAQPQLDEKLVIVVLRTLTLLLGEALIDRKEQIDRLLSYALHDTRETVQYNLFYDLVLLGKNDVMFDETHITKLLRIVVSMPVTMRLQQRAYKCARTLLRSHRQLVMQILWQESQSSVRHDFLQSINKCKLQLRELSNSGRVALADPCAQLLCTVLEIALQGDRVIDGMDLNQTNRTAQEMDQLGQDVMECTNRFNLSSIVQSSTSGTSNVQLRELLKLKARLCLLLNNVNVDTIFIDTYNVMLTSNRGTAPLLRKFLSTVSIKCKSVSDWFSNSAREEMKKHIQHPDIFVNLVRLHLCIVDEPSEGDDHILTLIRQFGGWDESREAFTANAWDVYIIGEEAGARGWFHLMYHIMRDLSKKVESDAYRYWLSFLSSLAFAECSRKTDSDQFLKVLNHLRSFQALASPRIFQSWYIQLRMELIKALQHMLTVLKVLQPGTPLTSMDNMKLERLMSTCAVRFRKLAFRYDFTAQSFFGMDTSDMTIIESYKICALACEHAARAFIKTSKSFICIDPSLIPFLQPVDSSRELSYNAKDTYIQNVCCQFIQRVTEWEQLEHTEEHDRKVQWTQDIHTFSHSILNQPLVLPKSFLHNPKNVTVQLTVDPVLDEKRPIELERDEDLVIKFEGFVQMPPQHLQRKVCKAAIVCFTTRQDIVHMDDRLGVGMLFSDPTQALDDEERESISLEPPTVFIANVNNSYFTYTGLLRLPTHRTTPGGQAVKQVWANVFVKLMDDQSKVWATGPLQYGRVTWK